MTQVKSSQWKIYSTESWPVFTLVNGVLERNITVFISKDIFLENMQCLL